MATSGGIRIADLGVSADGKIRLNFTDLHMAGLWDDDEATLADDDEFSKGPMPGRTSRIVEDNETSESAMMINAPIDDPEVDDLTIRRNRATGTSLMLNHRASMRQIEQLLILHGSRTEPRGSRSGEPNELGYQKRRGQEKRGSVELARRVRA